MDSSAIALIRSHHVNRMDEYIPNGTQKLLIQQGIPAATLYPAALLRFRNTYGLSKIHGMLMELPQWNSNTTSFKASGVEPELRFAHKDTSASKATAPQISKAGTLEHQWKNIICLNEAN